MRIMLIYPLISKQAFFSEYHLGNVPPLSLAYIAAYARAAGHSVKIVDRNIELYYQKYDRNALDNATKQHIQDFLPDWVGISVLTPQMFDAQHIANLCKSLNSEIMIVMGGRHASFDFKNILHKLHAVDVIAIGEGEKTIVDLLAKKPLNIIPGIAFRDSTGKIQRNSPQPLIADLNMLPYPARDLLDMAFYTAPWFSKSTWCRSTAMLTSRGCPYHCDFCAGNLDYNHTFRTASPQYVLGEIDNILGITNIECLHFADDIFGIDLQRDHLLFESMIKYGFNRRLKWVAQLHAVTAKPSLLKLMKAAGCIHIELGLESGSERMLTIMNKRGTVKLYENVIEMFNQVGLSYQINIIVGYYKETEEDLDKTLQFLEKTKPPRTRVSIFQPYPGTQVYKDLILAGYNVNWDGLDNAKIRKDGISGNEVNSMYNYSYIESHAFQEKYKPHFDRWYVMRNRYYALFNHLKQYGFSLPWVFLFIRWLFAVAQVTKLFTPLSNVIDKLNLEKRYYKLVHNYALKNSDIVKNCRDNIQFDDNYT